MKYIRFSIYSGKKNEAGITEQAVIRNIESNMPADTTNELPAIFNALAGTVNLVSEREDTGFDYTFDFILE